ncbi:hypothetical protein IE53DRAFT_365782 [Violaceomyces palustris]|uniref:Uncharacterized protein n=1 Tax=Violaceomyces palustris TaxID=1673888 RepID=A0ACD0P7T9_9BASI|nr:hypothetical protein IE53DRAFT_365782 [Violaceomyces palustris]
MTLANLSSQGPKPLSSDHRQVPGTSAVKPEAITSRQATQPSAPAPVPSKGKGKEIFHQRGRSDTSLGPRKDDTRPRTPGDPTTRIPTSAPATPARPARSSLLPSPRSLKVAARESILRRWAPCSRCVKFARACLPPVAGDTKQVRCQACQDDRSHPTCSTGRRLFGRQNRRDHHLPGGSSWNAIELSSDEDFELLDEPPAAPSPTDRTPAGDQIKKGKQEDLPLAAPRQTSAPAALASAPPLPRLRLPFSPGELVDELEDDPPTDEEDLPSAPTTPSFRVSPPSWD